jgi:AraC-like DNA-binding protein
MAEEKTSREFLLAKLDLILENLPGREVLFSQVSPLPSRPVAMHTIPRIIIPLSGVKQLELAQNGGREKISLSPWQPLFCMPYGWTRPVWDEAHSMISIVYSPDYTRILYLQHNGRPPAPNGPEIYYHTTVGLPETALHVLKALVSLAPSTERTPHDGLLLQSLVGLTRSQLAADSQEVRGKARRTLRMLQEYVETHCHLPINRESVAAQFRLNPSYLSRLFKEQGRDGFSEYLRHLRLDKALHLLHSPQLTIDEVTAQCGFRNTTHFIRIFKECYGTSPGRFRQRN